MEHFFAAFSNSKTNKLNLHLNLNLYFICFDVRCESLKKLSLQNIPHDLHLKVTFAPQSLAKNLKTKI